VKVLVEMDFLIYDAKVYVEMEMPKGSTAAEIQHRKDLIEDRITRGPGIGDTMITFDGRKP